ncbi:MULTISPECIES: type II toxin-antitoxin system RelE/ParE family toxin [unclassified Lentimicrobium]|uniref:type II toxin-antitoxin system RelE/ParE family toxin n=1 Tax=unclassified Lentimicrobium TaxID=2677434 RepID=UPI001552C759|nr:MULTISPECIES: type II toxin-antitoxin system RelE/ParE family toxin [unclassified Lentimicrobium]NPD43955.1 type II toxin-antitoxin system RelE/ParE family toxin [Lentimicrobium sp. S6]NPD84170.1 type II toxin-antitoxin system RelE/ParE family toxin [Lentimicrobium sp. L6]
MYNLTFRPPAKNDLQEIIEYYDSINPKLADVFLQQLDKAVYHIQNYPLSCQKKFSSIRVVFLKRFSYGIYFIINQQEIAVIAILHSSRNPKIWRTR